jgi:hypothetical protein
MKLIFGLVGVAALLFLAGGIGTIAAFMTHASGGTRTVFMYVFLAGLIPTMAFLAISMGIGIYHLYLRRVAKRTPTGWLASEQGLDENPDY